MSPADASHGRTKQSLFSTLSNRLKNQNSAIPEEAAEESNMRDYPEGMTELGGLSNK